MKEISASLGEQVISHDPGEVLVAYGLGSCVGVVMIDPLRHIAGLLHAVLPRPPESGQGMPANPCKYVESGIESLMAAMLRAGAGQGRLVVRIAGGANLLASSGLTSTFDIGTRNLEAARTTLERLKMPIAASATGGHIGRTIRVYVGENRVTVRVIGEKEREM